MFVKTTVQRSLFEIDNIYPGLFPKDDWCYIYRDYIYPLIDEDAYKHLYSDNNLGAPNKSIKLKISILIFMMIERLHWREAEMMFDRRMDWLIATFTAPGEVHIDFTTLFKFFLDLENDEVALSLFTDLTKEFIKLTGISTKHQRGDSFFMIGWLKILSRYGLFKETIRKFLQSLRKQKSGLYADIKKELSKDYLEKDFDLTEKDREKATRKTQDMANDMFMLIEAFSNHKQIQHYETFKIMQTVFEQQCAIKLSSEQVDNSEKPAKDSSNRSSKKKKKSGKSNSKKKSIVELREKPVGDKIISSPHNPDAEYTKKRKQKIVGHKGFISETCDPKNKVQFITDVNLEKASFSDSEELENIIDRLQKNKLAPEDFNLDAGFINGKTILSSAEKDINLIGPAAGHSQDSGKYNKDAHPFDISDFTVEIDDKTKELTVISCPEGLVPQDQIRSEKTDKILVHFNPKCCDNCPSKGKCPVNIGKTVSTLTTDEAQYAGAKRHKIFMEDEEYRKSCAIRSGAESLVHEITAGHDCRKSRHRSEKGSRLQLIFGAIACNVKRFLHYMADSAQNQVMLAEINHQNRFVSVFFRKFG